MKKIQCKKHFSIIFGPLTKTIMDLIYHSIFLVHFTMLAPNPKSHLASQL